MVARSRDDLLVVGRAVRDRREALGLNQRELGDRLGITQKMVGAVERGETPLPPRLAGGLARELGFEVKALMLQEDWEDEAKRAVALMAALDAPAREAAFALLEQLAKKR